MPANRIRMLFVLAMIAFAMPLRAQNATLTGKISNREGKGVPGAIIQAMTGTRIIAADTANSDGEYRLTVPTAGGYLVTVKAIGYSRVTRDNLMIGAGGSTNLDFRLQESVIQLDVVQTVASRAPEKVLDAPASVQVVSTQAVQERAAVNVADHVAALPGRRVGRDPRPPGRSRRGSCSAARRPPPS